MVFFSSVDIVAFSVFPSYQPGSLINH